MKRMKKTRHPPALTANCRAERASARQEVGGPLDAVASIREALRQATKGEGHLADEVFDELELEDSTG